MEKIKFKEAQQKFSDAFQKITPTPIPKLHQDLANAAVESAKNIEGFTKSVKSFEDFLERCIPKGYKSVEPHRPPRRKRKRRANWEHKIEKFDPENEVCKIRFCKLYVLIGGEYVKMKQRE